MQVVGCAIDQRWPVALAGVGYRLAGNAIDGNYVGAIDGDRREGKTLSIKVSLPGERVAPGDEQDGQPVCPGKMERLTPRGGRGAA